MPMMREGEEESGAHGREMPRDSERLGEKLRERERARESESQRVRESRRREEERVFNAPRSSIPSLTHRAKFA